MLKWKVFRSPWLAIAWFLTMNILFFLPGSALPQSNVFTEIYFDKWAHVGLFAGLVFLWRSAFDWNIKTYEAWIFMLSVLYGFVVELIQQNLVANRSFDMYDLMADTAGVVLGLLVWWRVYKKNKPL